MAAPLTDQPAVETALLRPLTDTEAGFVNQADTGLIAQASSQLRNRLRAIDTRIAAFETDPTDPAGIDPDVVTGVLGEVVARVLRNPKGLISATTTTGPFSRSETYRSSRVTAVAPTGVVVTDDDLALILPPVITDGYIPAGTIHTRPPHLLGPIGPRW